MLTKLSRLLDVRSLILHAWSMSFAHKKALDTLESEQSSSLYDFLPWKNTLLTSFQGSILSRERCTECEKCRSSWDLKLVAVTVAPGRRTWKELKSREFFLVIILSTWNSYSGGIAEFHGRHHRRVKRTPPRRARMCTLSRASRLACERTYVHIFRWRNGEPWRWPRATDRFLIINICNVNFTEL